MTLIATNSNIITELPERYFFDLNIDEKRLSKLLNILQDISLDKEQRLGVIKDLMIEIPNNPLVKGNQININDDIINLVDIVNNDKSDIEKPKSKFPKPNFKKKIDFKP